MTGFWTDIGTRASIVYSPTCNVGQYKALFVQYIRIEYVQVYRIYHMYIGYGLNHIVNHWVIFCYMSMRHRNSELNTGNRQRGLVNASGRSPQNPLKLDHRRQPIVLAKYPVKLLRVFEIFRTDGSVNKYLKWNIMCIGYLHPIICLYMNILITYIKTGWTTRYIGFF